MKSYNNTTNKENVNLSYINNLKSICEIGNDVANSTLSIWFEYMKQMSESFEKFITNTTDVNIYSNKNIDQIYYLTLMNFKQVVKTCKQFIHKFENDIFAYDVSLYKNEVHKYEEKYNEYSKYYKKTFYLYLTKKEKKQLDDYCFLEFEERII